MCSFNLVPVAQDFDDYFSIFVDIELHLHGRYCTRKSKPFLEFNVRFILLCCIFSCFVFKNSRWYKKALVYRRFAKIESDRSKYLNCTV